MRPFVALACLGIVLAGGATRFTSAAFTASTSIGSNGVTVDQLSNYFSVTPISSVATGNVDNLTLALGTVPSARSLTSVFRVTNVSSSSQTAVFTLSGVPQISSVVFASSGSSTATLAAGASTTVTVATSSTVCGHGAGTLKLALSGSNWLYRTYSVSIDEAPEAPGAPTATQKPAGRIDISWGQTPTTTNLAGYNLYRSSGGGAYTKLNTSTLTGTTYTDTATSDGVSYTYKVTALSTDATPLESLDSATVTKAADATPPTQPTAISLANGGGSGGAYINSSNAGSLSVTVTLASGWLATDNVTLTLSSGGASVTRQVAATSGSVTFSGLNVSAFAEGSVSASVTSTDAAGNVSTARTATFAKDTVAPGAPTATYTDNNNAVDGISGTAEANAAISVTQTLPTAGSYSTTANASGAYSLQVATVNGKNSAPVTVAYSVKATDAAGNTSVATPLTFSDIR
jgi:fibronectin-binding autotransporter adhesin